ncbi:hypothetical protein LCGC14_0970070 [marine sediment metagenome]|uniref:DNA methylase N-4/N-6 domain-containing protein n=1 Tax=marine sediment metagenome TaxID=412755 RepID=A0A0F9NGC4_9ZZZZ
MIIRGDCIEQMKKLEENSVDAIVTDPPYGIGFMGKEWDRFSPQVIKEATKKHLKIDHRKQSERSSSMHSGTYDTSISGSRGFQEFCLQWSIEALRILKPGGYMLVSCSTRMYHRMACGIEDAGFEIRDCIMWLYGSGFPKSLNIGKQIDKTEGNERESLGIKDHAKKDFKDNLYAQDPANRNNEKVFGYGKEELTKGNSEWEGWGTALKPAVEPIVVARKPLSEKNVALNVLKWGTGGINIDACRIETFEPIQSQSGHKGQPFEKRDREVTPREYQTQGRFPANIILDKEAGEILDEQSGNLKSGKMNQNHIRHTDGSPNGIYGKFDPNHPLGETFGDKGGASRFFYVAKASKSERNFGMEEKQTVKQFEEKKTDDGREVVSDRPHQRGATNRKNNHPTVKPIKLIEYLIKLISKENSIVLDPFTGSGTTGIACAKLNRQFIGFEKEEEYVKIAKARIKPYLEQTKL